MTIGYDEVVFGTTILDTRNLTRRKVPGTIKQKVGGKLVKHRIPGRTTRDWEITVRGIVFDRAGTAATTARAEIESMYDLEERQYSDGYVTATMVMEDLTFNDSGDNPLHFEYTAKFIEFNQVD